MKEHCLNHNKVHEHHAWKTSGEGWYCIDKGAYTEFVPQRIKDDRVKYKKDIVQPFRGGVPSKEFADTYPKQAKKIFGKDIDKAKYVWKGTPGW